jgi:hypothetical protein
MLKTIEPIIKKAEGSCEALHCEELALFESRYCWAHIPEEEKKAYRKKIESKVQKKESFKGAVLYKADLSRADLSGANLSEAVLCEANLSGAELSGTNLYKAYLYKANLSRAKLSRANLSVAELSGANLCEANLSEANLSEADLSRANLTWANLYKANLYKANLSGAYLSGANLSEANLSEANLYEANLYKANLSGACLSGANLSGAELSRVNLSRAHLEDAIFPMGFQVVAGSSEKNDPTEGPLSTEIAHFNEKKEEFLKVHEGEYVAIKGKEVICFKKSEGDVIKEVYVKRGEKGPVLIRRVTREEPIHFIRI